MRIMKNEESENTMSSDRPLARYQGASASAEGGLTSPITGLLAQARTCSCHGHTQRIVLVGERQYGARAQWCCTWLLRCTHLHSGQESCACSHVSAHSRWYMCAQGKRSRSAVSSTLGSPAGSSCA